MQFVEERYDGQIEWRSIFSQSSGEVTDRESYREMKDLIGAGWPDLIIAEDLGRICRRIEALVICERCQDHDTRLIALNDHVDTADPNWKVSASFATLQHEPHSQDTADRIRRSVRNRFTNGSILVVLPFGYLHPEGATTDDQLSKDPDAEPIYDRWFEML